MSNELVPFERQMVLAKAFADSKLFGITDASQALTLMALCEGQGLHPSTALADYHLIQGRPSLKADAMLARFQRSGGTVEFGAYTDERVEATFKHPQGGTLVVDWDMKRAAAAGLASNANYKKYPRQMLRSRVISEGVRSLFPGVLGGLYTPEEVQDFEPAGLKVDPRGDIQPMDSEIKAQYVGQIAQHLDQIKATTIGEVPTDTSAIAAWDLYRELTKDEQMHVFGGFNTKQKARWRKLEGAMTKHTNGAAA